MTVLSSKLSGTSHDGPDSVIFILTIQLGECVMLLLDKPQSCLATSYKKKFITSG